MQENQSNNSADNKVSLGALLLSARNKISLSQANVADQINLSLASVKSLEADDYENLPSALYVRGYLRNYARVVDMDAETLIAAYDKQQPEAKVVNKLSSPSVSYDPAILWSTAVVLTILLGLFYTWWVDDRKISSESFALRTSDSVTIPEVVAPAVEATTAVSVSTSVNDEQNVENTSPPSQQSVDVVDENSVVSSSATLDNTITADVEQAMEDESMNPVLVSVSTGSDVLTVTYVQKSWTEIRDADANPLMQGLIEPGVVRNLSGKAPFSIFLGNSPGVVIEVNGQYFDHSQYLKSNRTARFEVSSGTFN